MSPALQAAGRAAHRWRALGTVLLMVAPLQARADLWMIEDTFNARLETNDNAALQPQSPGTVNSLYLTGTLDASRQMENSVTRLKTDLTAVRQQGAAARDRLDGLLRLSHVLNDPLNTFSVTGQYTQDFNNVVSNADVTQAQGQRRNTAATAGWTRALSERASANLQLSAERTTYGAQLAGAVDFRDTSVSAGASYALSELLNLGLQASRSQYRAADGSNRSDTDSFNLTLSRLTSERGNASIGLGAYRTASEARGLRVFCPLPISFCRGGLVSFQVAEERIASSRTGLQFSGAYKHQFDEITDASMSISRQQSPSGAGVVVRNDLLSLSINRAFSPTMYGAVNFTRSRSVYPEGIGLGASSPTQSTLDVSVSRQLASDLTLQAGYRRSIVSAFASRGGASSNSFSVSLQYDGPKLRASR